MWASPPGTVEGKAVEGVYDERADKGVSFSFGRGHVVWLSLCKYAHSVAGRCSNLRSVCAVYRASVCADDVTHLAFSGLTHVSLLLCSN